MCQIEAHEIRHYKGPHCMPVVSHSLGTIKVTVRFGSRFHPNFETVSGLVPINFRIDGYLEYQHAAKALYIYKHPCLLRDSNPSPTAQQSASLTAIPDGRQKKV
ncbi:hypothetical protein TNCV_182321 [Trichonephila clavipes]|nr:hypothetical protein TNCV_182321 [Trichonephila clavipes]